MTDIAAIDRKAWYVLSMPTDGIRFDRRMLALMDYDHDGRIRIDEVLAAGAFLAEKGVAWDVTDEPSDEDAKALEDVTARLADLEKTQPSEADVQAQNDWVAAGKAADVSFLGAATGAAEEALAQVEPVIDAFFTPPDDMPLVTDEPDVVLPLKDHLNPKHLEAVLDFAAKCVVPVLGERETLSRIEWKAIKAKFAPYRAWRAAKPTPFAAARAELEDEERVLRYKTGLPKLMRNYLGMEDLYDPKKTAIFQVGTLRIDAKELNLCFAVSDEAAHAALAGKSACCILYLKLTRPGENATRHICAVVTAGRVGGLYVGRNGVFQDCDGKDWEAVVTRVLEAQVSLVEAFWMPWRKMGEAIMGMVEKFVGEKQVKSPDALGQMAKQQAVKQSEAKQNAGGNGAALASSVAAIGIGIGMVGAAVASLMAAIKGLLWWQILIGVAAIILAVSLPSVVLAWFKLRKRDLGAILNAGGWAVNRSMRFSMRLARTFTRVK